MQMAQSNRETKKKYEKQKNKKWKHTKTKREKEDEGTLETARLFPDRYFSYKVK